jgi:hypothetical protein
MYTVSGSAVACKLTRIARQLAAHGLKAFRARMIGHVCARQITSQTALQDDAAGQRGAIGDWLVTNMGKDRRFIGKDDGRPDTYVVPKDKFANLYQRDTGFTEFGEAYAPISVVDAVELPGGLDIVASWGDRRRFAAGFLLRNGREVYGADTPTFFSTFEYKGDAAASA